MWVKELPGQTLLRGIGAPCSMHASAYRARRAFRDRLGVDERGAGARGPTKHETRKSSIVHFVSLHREPIGPPQWLVSRFGYDQCSTHLVRKRNRISLAGQAGSVCQLYLSGVYAYFFVPLSKKFSNLPFLVEIHLFHGAKCTKSYAVAPIGSRCAKLYTDGISRSSSKY